MSHLKPHKVLSHQVLRSVEARVGEQVNDINKLSSGVQDYRARLAAGHITVNDRNVRAEDDILEVQPSHHLCDRSGHPARLAAEWSGHCNPLPVSQQTKRTRD